MIAVGVIGYGYWGPNLARNFADVPDVHVAAISDSKDERLARAAIRHPKTELTTDARSILDDPRIDAVAIATPVSTHFDLAMHALRAGKHVLVSKPLAATVEQGERLVEEAARRGLTLMVDHTFVYTDAVRKMKELIDNGDLGELYYYDAVRVSLGLFRHDVNVLWDLASHDFAIMDHVLPMAPRAVSANGVAHVPGQVENLAYVTCLFDGRFIAHVHVNWLAPVKVRRTMIGGDARMIVYDDVEPSEKIKIYDRGVTVNGNDESLYRAFIGYRTGDMSAPRLDPAEALRVEAEHFVHCVETGATPLTDGRAGLRVVRLLAAASESLAQHGRTAEINGLG